MGYNREQTGALRLFVINFIRILLLLILSTSWYYRRNLVLLFALVGLIITFVPALIRSFFKKTMPASFEITVLLFVYMLLIYWDIKLLQQGIWWTDLLLHLGSAIILGFIGLALFSALNNQELLDTSSAMIAFFSFCFSFSLGSFWELIEYSLDTLFGFTLQSGLQDTMQDLLMLAIGAILVALFGYRSLRNGDPNIFSTFITRFVTQRLQPFKTKKYLEYTSNRLLELIQNGEGNNLEFKSTLRKNLHTGAIDKEIEHSTLKTIAAYLNTQGGTLLIGVSDTGSLIGLDTDEFANHDKFKLYLNQILRKQLGSPVLKHVSYEIYPVQDKHILKIECRPSPRRVFLRRDGRQEFYVRYGPSTVQLQGEELIDYVNEHFG